MVFEHRIQKVIEKRTGFVLLTLIMVLFRVMYMTVMLRGILVFLTLKQVNFVYYL